jgi:integrase/recombinase XerD
MIKTEDIKGSTQNVCINALKFYLEKVKGEDARDYYLNRTINEKKLPTVLSEDEVKRMFKQTRNLKHIAIMMVFYSSGLRLSELLSLEWRDIDEERGLINVRGGKGSKDRITLLSKLALNALRAFREKYKPAKLVFEGVNGEPYGRCSISNVIKACAHAAGIKKNVSPHPAAYVCYTFVGTRNRFAVHSGLAWP